MVKWIKNLFRSRNKQLTKPAVIHSITCGERDENGSIECSPPCYRKEIQINYLGMKL
jgi:hypothetical protein